MRASRSCVGVIAWMVTQWWLILGIPSGTKKSPTAGVGLSLYFQTYMMIAHNQGHPTTCSTSGGPKQFQECGPVQLVVTRERVPVIMLVEHVECGDRCYEGDGFPLLGGRVLPGSEREVPMPVPPGGERRVTPALAAEGVQRGGEVWLVVQRAGGGELVEFPCDGWDAERGDGFNSAGEKEDCFECFCVGEERGAVHAAGWSRVASGVAGWVVHAAFLVLLPAVLSERDGDAVGDGSEPRAGQGVGRGTGFDFGQHCWPPGW